MQKLLINVETGEQTLVNMTTEEISEILSNTSEPTYSEKRSFEYPPIGDQLDALFHAGVFPKEMADKIQSVKNKYPKPQ